MRRSDLLSRVSRTAAQRKICFSHAVGTGGDGLGALVLTRDEARRIAANIAKLPELLKGSGTEPGRDASERDTVLLS